MNHMSTDRINIPDHSDAYPRYWSVRKNVKTELLGMEN